MPFLRAPDNYNAEWESGERTESACKQSQPSRHHHHYHHHHHHHHRRRRRRRRHLMHAWVNTLTVPKRASGGRG